MRGLTKMVNVVYDERNGRLEMLYVLMRDYFELLYL